MANLAREDLLKEVKKHVGENYEWTCKMYGTSGCAWCSCFIYAIFKQLNRLDLILNIKSSFVNTYENAFQGKLEKITDLSKVKVGDIVFFDWDGDKDEDHVGFVVADGYSASQIKTIEGNTTKVAGKDEGWRKNIVNEKIRYKADILSIYRPKYDDSPAPTPTPSKDYEVGQKVKFKGGKYWTNASGGSSKNGKECVATITRKYSGKYGYHIKNLDYPNVEYVYGWVGVDQLEKYAEPAPEPKRTYLVKKGDTLWDLAIKFYGNGSLSTKIAEANGIKNPREEVKEGMTLIIPR